MLRPFSKITFTKPDGTVLSFDFVNEVTIKSSFETLTDTATITIPRKLNLNGKPIAASLNAIFNRGDAVKIELGYYPNIRTVFEGYITKAHPTTPIVIDCEDAMFLLKKSVFTFPLEYTTITKDKKGELLKTPKKSYREISLTELLDAIKTTLPETIEIKNIAKVESLGHIRFSDVTPAQALEYLNENYGIYSNFVNGVLNVGLASDASDTAVKEFTFEKQVIRDNMEFQISDNLQLKVVVTSFNTETNAKLTATAGDADGEVRTYHYQNLSQSECQEHADNLIAQRKFDGYRGTFTTFGEPFVRHGDGAKMIRLTPRFEETDGIYTVVSVERVFGMGGYRQNIELGAII